MRETRISFPANVRGERINSRTKRMRKTRVRTRYGVLDPDVVLWQIDVLAVIPGRSAAAVLGTQG